MDLRRLRVGEWLMAVAGVALLAVVALHGEFGVASVLLTVLGLAAVGAVAMVAGAGTSAPGIAYETLVLLGSILGFVVALVAGMWAALIAVIVVAAMTLVAMRDERRSTPDRLTDATGLPVESAPEPEHLPAPGT